MLFPPSSIRETFLSSQQNEGLIIEKNFEDNMPTHIKAWIKANVHTEEGEWKPITGSEEQGNAPNSKTATTLQPSVAAIK